MQIHYLIPSRNPEQVCMHCGYCVSSDEMVATDTPWGQVGLQQMDMLCEIFLFDISWPLLNEMNIDENVNLDREL